MPDPFASLHLAQAPLFTTISSSRKDLLPTKDHYNFQSKKACERGPLALVAAAIIKASEKELFVEHEFAVLGTKSKATGKRGEPFASDLAILDNSDSDSESSSSEGEVSAVDSTMLTLVAPPQNPVIVLELLLVYYNSNFRLLLTAL